MTQPRTGIVPSEVERELIFLCARTRLDAVGVKRLRELTSMEVDWAWMLKEAAWHDTIPLLHHHLSRHVPDALPSALSDELRDRFRIEVRHNLLLAARLGELLRGLDALGVSAIALKGPVLETLLYPTTGLRSFGDLDVVVQPEHARLAMAFLKECGYRPQFHLEGAREKMYLRTRYAMPFLAPDDGTWVDLHWGLAKRYFAAPLQPAALRRETQAVTLGGTQVDTLRPDLLLVTLCIHGAKHGPFPWPRLKWISDLDAFVYTHRDLDWDTVLGRAGRLGCRRMVLLGLGLAHGVLGSPLPARVEGEVMRDKAVQRYVEDIESRLLAKPQGYGFRERTTFDVAIRERSRDRARYLLRRLLSPEKRDWWNTRLPRALTFLHVPFRVSRLAGRYVARPARIRGLFRKEEAKKEPLSSGREA